MRRPLLSSNPPSPASTLASRRRSYRVARCAPALRNRRPRKDARRREERQRQRHLTDDHEVAHAETPPASGRLTAAILQVGHQVAARQLQRRPESEGDRAHGGKRERRRKHADVGTRAERHVERQRRHQRRRQRACRPIAQHQAKYSAGAGEEDALGEQLANDASPSRAKREADGQFLAARRAARQQHVGDIQARNHEYDTGQRQHQPGQHLQSNVRGWRGAGTDTRQWIRRQGLVLVLCGVRGLELAGQGVESSCEHGVTEARFQTAGEYQAVVRPIGQLLAVAPLRIRNDRCRRLQAGDRHPRTATPLSR